MVLRVAVRSNNTDVHGEVLNFGQRVALETCLANSRGHLNVLKINPEVTHRDMCSLCIDEHGNNLLHAAAVARTGSAEGQLEVFDRRAEMRQDSSQ